MGYSLENIKEADRLKRQTQTPNFSIEREFKNITFPGKDKKILDAGCGSGDLLNYLLGKYKNHQYFGCDQSKERIRYCQQNCDKEINFFQHDFVKDPFPFHYDIIINRYVAHHLGVESYQKTLEHFFLALNPNGVLHITDPDGLMLNIGTTNKALLDHLTKFPEFFSGDLTIGRKIPKLLDQIGFQKITYSVEVMDFQKEERKMEAAQWEERLEFAHTTLVQVLGSETKAKEFVKLYLEEILNPYVPLFYNKFIIQAEKPNLIKIK